MRPERKASVMERLRSLARKTFSYPKLLMSTHPVTGISVIITTALFVAYTFAEAAADYQRDFGILLHIGIAAMFFTVFSLFLESVRPKWSIPSGIAVFALFALLSGFMSFINYDFNTGRSSNALANILSLWQDRLGTTSVMIYTAGIIAAAFLFAVYFSYTRCVRQEFNEHVINSVSCIFYTSIIYGVIQIGVILLTAIVEILLFDDAFMYLGGILVIINGIFYAPAFIVALIHENRPANAFFRALVRYVMLIISVIAYAIIYIYIIKLAVTRSVPSNSVFAILTALFVLTLPVSYMCTSFEDKGILQKFAFNTPVIFAPFIIMQLYTAIVRIGQYGLTPKRYFGIAFILFELIYIVYYMYSYKRGHVIAGENILLIICSIVVISFVAPGINAVSLSGSAAKHTLASCLDKMSDGTATDSLYIRANAAYSFLSDNDYGKGRTASYFPDLDNDTVESLRENARRASANKYSPKNTSDTSGNNLYCIFNASIGDIEGTPEHIDISDYDSISIIRIEGDAGADLTALDMYYAADNASLPVEGYETVDLKDFTDKLTALAERQDNEEISWDEYMRQAYTLAGIDLDENARLYITEADITMDPRREPVNIFINGYLLLK